MSQYLIQGNAKLSGEVSVLGAKNGALKALAAALLSEAAMTIEGVPDIEDIQRQIELLELLGCTVSWDKKGHTVVVDSRKAELKSLDPILFGRLRGSMALTGSLLARFGEVRFPDPGGCSIGMRPIDKFLYGFQQMGAQIKKSDGMFSVTCKHLKGARIVFTNVSVVATESLMMAAARAEGTTELVNAACEPEISNLAKYLNQQGAKIRGAGTPCITIEGVEQLSAGIFHNIPDRLEAGFWAISAATTGSALRITHCRPEHLEVALTLLKQMGAGISWNKDSITVKSGGELQAVNIKTHEYPGLATDLQPFFTMLLTQAQGQALVHETIFESRLAFAGELNRMGANITICDPHRIIIQGPTPLEGRLLMCPDARAGTAYLIAGLVASGTTTLQNIYQLERGFERLPERLNALGARIERVEK